MPRANANKWTRGRMVDFASCVDIFMEESYGSLVNGCTVVDMVVFYSMSVCLCFMYYCVMMHLLRLVQYTLPLFTGSRLVLTGGEYSCHLRHPCSRLVVSCGVACHVSATGTAVLVSTSVCVCVCVCVVR